MNQLLIAATLTFCSAAYANPQQVLGTPFNRYTTPDSFGRQITFYVSNGGSDHLPLALIVQGSGCWSVFTQPSEGKISGWHQNTLFSIAANRFRVMIPDPKF